MKTIIEKLFNEYGFNCLKKDVFDSVDFYMPISEEKVDFYMVYYVDLSDSKFVEIDAIEQLSVLQSEFVDNGDKIKELLTDRQKTQLDKNTTGIYVVRLSNIDKSSDLRNVVYSLEESPYYFKKYVFLYSQGQLEDFKHYININRYDINSALNAYINIAG